MHRGGLNLHRCPIILDQALDRHVESKPGWYVHADLRFADVLRLKFDFVNAFGKVCFCHRQILKNATCKMQNTK